MSFHDQIITVLKAWFPPMSLTYSHAYFDENIYNPIGRYASNNLKKNLTTFLVNIRFSYKNIIKMF